MARVLKLLLVAALLLPTSVLQSRVGEAQSTGDCADGTIVEGLCVVDHGPPTCTDDSALVDGACLKIEPPTIDVQCPQGTLGEPGQCHVILEAEDVLGCEIGGLVGGNCVSVEPAPTGCPDGYEATAALGGICARFEPAEQLPPDCPEGAYGVPGDCYILVAKGPRGYVCEEGELVSTACVIAGEPPVPGPSTCPVSATLFFLEGRCFTLVAANGDGSCPGDLLPNGALCEQPEPLRPGALTCQPGFGLVDGGCVRYEDPVPGEAHCPAGSTEDTEGNCRKPVADVPGAPYCPDPTSALNGASCVFTTGFILGPCPDGGTLDGSNCIMLSDPQVESVCPFDSSPIGDGLCRKDVADALIPVCANDDAELTDGGCVLRSDPECELGELVEGSCLEYIEVDFYCAGELVTINLQRGDPGVGTSGPDVILGTNGPDEIDARGGDDVICALNGDDVVDGGGGADIIFGDGGDDNIRGGSGHDDIRGGSGNDDIRSGSGDDDVRGGNGDDDIRGGSGDDQLRGGGDQDVIRGGSGDDQLRGGSDDDRLLGQADRDDLRGDGGNDECNGGSDIDTAASSCESQRHIP